MEENFQMIPYSDIILFLEVNNEKLSYDKDDNYNIAWNLINNNQGDIVAPLSVIDYVLAINSNDKDIKSISSFDIITASENNLLTLTNILGLLIVNKERILRILRYANKLDENIGVLSAVPIEILLKIISNLEPKDIILLCDVNTKLINICKDYTKEIIGDKLGLNVQALTYQEIKQLIHMITNTKINYHIYTTDELKALIKIYKNKYYAGIIDNNGKFYIYNLKKFFEADLIFMFGIDCNEYDISSLINILKDLNTIYDEKSIIHHYMLSWLHPNVYKEELCSVIKAQMMSLGIIYKIEFLDNMSQK